MVSRRNFLGGSGARAARCSAGQQGGRGFASRSANDDDKTATQPPLVPPNGPALYARCYTQWLDAAVAHEKRLEGVSSRSPSRSCAKWRRA